MVACTLTVVWRSVSCLVIQSFKKRNAEKECLQGVRVPLIEAGDVEGVVAAVAADTVKDDKDTKMEVDNNRN